MQTSYNLGSSQVLISIKIAGACRTTLPWSRRARRRKRRSAFVPCSIATMVIPAPQMWRLHHPSGAFIKLLPVLSAGTPGAEAPMAVEPREARPGGLYTSGNRALTLDSPAFDADRYLAQLLRSSRMSTLLQKQLEMSAEVKSLDSDMQMLVYENYNKFISATDTIRNMKTDVESMDSKMKDLKQIIGPIPDLRMPQLPLGKDMKK